jgi:hypothetical protein
MSRCSIFGGIGLLSVTVVVAGVVAQGAGASNPRWPPGVFGQSTHTMTPPPGTTPFRGARVIVRRLTHVSTTYVDNPPTGTSVGDSLAGEGTLITVHGRTTGHLDFQETLTGLGPEPNTGRLQLAATARLPHGQIDIGGVVAFNQSKDPILAIIGGTERFHAARGQVIVHAGPHATRLTFWVTN